MNQQAQSCYLKSNDKTLKTVYLPHKKSIILGRSEETNITDTRCSRQQGYNFTLSPMQLSIILIHTLSIMCALCIIFCSTTICRL